ncbi:MAG: hydratase [Pseudomonadota bacterium]
MTISPQQAAAEAEAILTARSEATQLQPISERIEDFSMMDAKAVAERVLALRTAQGEARVGRKIGFTNRSIWETFGVDAPIWGDMFDTSVHEIGTGAVDVTLPPLTEPRIEPEIVFGLGRAPDAGMSLSDLAQTIEWVAHGFEVVSTVFPGWKQTAADGRAAFAMHAGLYMGPRHPLAALGSDPVGTLAALTLDLTDGTIKAQGRGVDVLDGPVSALSHLIDGLAQEGSDGLAPSDIITTGTLTDAFPLEPGARWRTTLRGVPMEGLDVTFHQPNA